MSSQGYGGEKSKTKLLAARALYEDSRGGPFLNSLVLSIPWLVGASLQSLPLFTWLLPVAPGPHMAVFISYENTNRIGLESERESHSVVPDSLRPRGPHGPWNSPGQNPGLGSLSLLQGIFPNPGIKPRSHIFLADSLLAEPPGLLD